MNSLRNLRVLARLAVANGRQMSGATKKVNVKDLIPMVYPYTYTAKLAQFPFAYHFKQCWLHRYLCYSVIVCYPLFLFIHFKGMFLLAGFVVLSSNVLKTSFVLPCSQLT